MIGTAEASGEQGFLSRIGQMQVTAALVSGRHAEALKAARRARRRGRQADAGLWLAETDALLNLMRYREAAAVAARAIKQGPSDDDTVARLRLARAQALWMMGQVAFARAELQRAEPLAAAPLTRARSLDLAGLLAWKDQRREEARSRIQEAGRLCAGAGSPVGLVRALEKEAGLLRDEGRFDSALRVLARAVDVAAATTRLDVLAQARAERGDLLAFLGRWQEACLELDAAADLFRRLGDPREQLLVAPKRAMVDLARGELAAVRHALAEIGAAALDDSAQRLKAEHRLLAADLHLAAGEVSASEAAAAEAVALLAAARCREGESRARVRRAHALVMLRRLDDAISEARRAARLAPEARRDLRLLALLARGRAILRRDRSAARESFEAALRLADSRPGPLAAARLGILVAAGAGPEAPEVRGALAALEAWGDRRLVAYALADLRAVCGAGQDVVVEASGEPSAALPPACVSSRVLVEAAAALLGPAPWSCRWAAAMRAARPLLPWWRAAWVSVPGCELRRDLDAPVPLADDDFARRIAAGVRSPALVNLSGAGANGALHGVTRAIVAPAPGGVLYFDFRDDAELSAGTPLGLAAELARLVAAREPEPEVEEKPTPRFPEIVGRCEAMQSLFDQVARVAACSSPIHVVGETGTGKEKVARAIHAHSPWRQGPFVPVNAAALPDELFESEMFGCAKGAFTGAVADRRGYVAAAEGGTLFLDEVAELSPRAQVKLLRFLENGEYMRVGEAELKRSRVRIVSAANAGLAERVRAGRFREDLMYRLTDFTLMLPPLRERGDDVLLLARHFLKSAADENELAVPSLPAELARALRSYAWPGNVRQLRGEMRRLVVLGGGGPLSVQQLSFGGEPVPRQLPLREARAAFERELIARNLRGHAGNRSRTAAALGISRQALVVKIRQLGL
jgi:DNA-binding NtrC family response regulator/tetratricopeptide (TPR) repeat protein